MGLRAVANPLAGSALPSNVTSASLNSITPTGGALTITGDTLLSPGKYYSAFSPDGATRFDALALNGGSADLYSYLGSGTGHFRFLSGDSGGYVIVGTWGRGGLEVFGNVAASGAISATTSVKTGATTVVGLGSAATAGAGTRWFVTDANATTFASIVAGGGANAVPVYSDGTDWRIG